MSESTLLLEIKGNALDDGPGIRSVVFFKGCLLSCAWCHNPESISREPEISFDRSQCVGALECLRVCPDEALSRDDPQFIDRDRCTLCFDCVQACPSAALARVGEPASVDSVFTKLMKYKLFYVNSDGGVTLSGGEPTLHMEFASALLEKLKAEGIHTLLQTCGLFSFDRFEELLYPHLDLIYFDLKLFDRERHRQHCGVANDVILENFTRLQQAYRKGGVEVLARTPLVPGMTSDPCNLEAIAGFLNDRGVRHVQLMDYNPIWHDKCERLGSSTDAERDDPLRQWMSRDEVERCEAIFRAQGLEIA
ncbi:MAG: glycyl-radical enzyme activating protein [bacterium]|nr:glycyl-radical enzyme activating protein [bacterium]